jgi:hypothetical protein
MNTCVVSIVTVRATNNHAYVIARAIDHKAVILDVNIRGPGNGILSDVSHGCMTLNHLKLEKYRSGQANDHI